MINSTKELFCIGYEDASGNKPPNDLLILDPNYGKGYAFFSIQKAAEANEITEQTTSV